MSTKATIKLDEENVYLQIEDLNECCFEVWDSADGSTSSLVKVKIPVKNWKKLVKRWNSFKKKEK